MHECNSGTYRRVRSAVVRLGNAEVRPIVPNKGLIFYSLLFSSPENL